MDLSGRLPARFFRIGAFDVAADRNVIAEGDEEFHLEPKVIDVLCALAARPGEVLSREALLDEVWQVAHGSEESLTRAISLLRKIFRRVPGGETYIETVPKRGYRLNAPVTRPVQAAMAVPSVAASPGEAPPEAASTPPAPSRPPSRPERRWLILTLAAVLAVVAVSLGVLGLIRVASPEQTLRPEVVRDQVDVGPLHVEGNDPQLLRVADMLRTGVAETLTGAGLTTIGPLTRDGGPEGPGPAPEFRLDGAVGRAGEVVRARVEVRSNRDGTLVWAHSFDEEARDRNVAGLPALRDHVAARTAGVLGCAVGLRTAKARVRPDVFRLYVQFCAAARDPEASYNLGTYSQRILKADPDCPLAQGIHAAVLAMMAYWGVGGLTPGEAEQAAVQARDLAERSLRGDPANGFARVGMAITTPLPGGWAEAERHLLLALADKPGSAYVLPTYGRFLRQVGRLREATQAYARLVAADPVEGRGRTMFAWMLASTGHVAQAEEQMDRAQRQQPDRDTVDWYRLKVELFQGDPAEARRLIEQSDAPGLALGNDYRRCLLRYLRLREERRADGQALMAACPDVQPDMLARMLARIGDVDRAFRVYGRYAPSDAPATIGLFYPEMAAMRADPRFWPLAARHGLARYWLETGHWPDFCGVEVTVDRCRAQAQAAVRTLADAADPEVSASP